MCSQNYGYDEYDGYTTTAPRFTREVEKEESFWILLKEFHTIVEELNIDSFINKEQIKYSKKMLKEKYNQEWIIQESKINDYFEESKSINEFRKKIYTDINFVEWCKKYCKENKIQMRKSKFSREPILSAGDSWWNWKVGDKSDTGCLDSEKHLFLNPSFHYIKQMYDAYAQPKGKKNLD